MLNRPTFGGHIKISRFHLSLKDYNLIAFLANVKSYRFENSKSYRLLSECQIVLLRKL